ncbi:MAG: AAA family ATPase [Saprospiraceae bacterium]|nr:AAA family ATPase [Saprospiraceae bacterium]
MKNLPIGIQTLVEIRQKNGIYVDKTPLVHKLVTTGKYYFFSRPRRFGKSLLISTLKELYLGNKAIFEGLWICDKWDWTKTNPVIHFSFDKMSYRQLGLEGAIVQELKKWAKHYKIRFTTTDYKSQFEELLAKLSKKHGKVAFLVDEYDKPIIDFLEKHELDQAKANRDILREFYGVLKDSDTLLELVFITGISKFAKVSLFSHLNNLTDITLTEQYAALAGYTQAELEFYFEDYIESCTKKFGMSREELLRQVKVWYDGYSWDGQTELYNPFGTLNFFHDQFFKNYWFSTGSPNFLIEQMKKYSHFNVENSVVDTTILDKYDIDNLELIPLLFQTGYLTVKKANPLTGEYVLDYPNQEVRQSMYTFLIDDIAQNPHRIHTGMTIQDMNRAFASQNLAQVKTILESLLADLPDQTFQKQSEGLYHGLIHLVFSYLGLYASSEVHSSKGRADAVVQTLTDVYIFEFKFNKTAQEALDQIVKQNYAAKYQASGRTITGIGVNFNAVDKTIDGWLEQNL